MKTTATDFVTLPTGQKVPLSVVLEPIIPFSGNNTRANTIEKLPTVTGSIAGASSRFLTDYRKHRDWEATRLRHLELQGAEEDAMNEFEARKNERKRNLEDETNKKRDRRQKRKQRQVGGNAPEPSSEIAEPSTSQAPVSIGDIPQLRVDSVATRPIHNISIVDIE